LAEAERIPLNENANEHAIVSYIGEYLKYSRETKARLVISDRSVFDLFSYISVSRSGDVRDEFIRLAEDVVYQEVQKVYAYIYVPIEFELKVDGVRPADLLYQRTIDNKVQHLLRFFGARVVPVSGTVDERVAEVLKFLNDYITKA
jgi:predicted ATPase